MNKREVVRAVLEQRRPPYVPWSFGFTLEAKQALAAHLLPRGGSCTDAALRDEALDEAVGSHVLKLGSDIGFFEEAGPDLVRDVFGVLWDRSVDKDIGIVRGCALASPTLRGYTLPDPRDRRFFDDIPGRIQRHGDRFRIYQIGFSLWERAWTLRGIENLMMDFYDHPAFVRELLETIADYNLAQVEEALRYEIDAIYFGDDWVAQHGLQMGPALWREFLQPVLKRMYGAVRRAGKFVMIHSCGDVDELFDELIAIGLNCFNPFQPEVMDVYELLNRFRGRLCFFGGLSTQRLLPYGTPEEVRRESRRLLEAGSPGGYIFSPAHDVEGDVPLENMLAFIRTAQAQLEG